MHTFTMLKSRRRGFYNDKPTVFTPNLLQDKIYNQYLTNLEDALMNPRFPVEFFHNWQGSLLSAVFYF